MSSPFDRIPYEVLDRIIRCSKNDLSYLCRCKGVNKCWRSIAEKYLYDTLDLTFLNGGVTKYTLRFFEAMLGPHRTKLVKRLVIEDVEAPFDDSFFMAFSNIQEVIIFEAKWANWADFSDIFTPDRCQLKSLDYNSDIPTYQLINYLEVAIAHRHTLEELCIPVMKSSEEEDDDISSIEDIEISSCIEYINDYSLSFPNVKKLFVFETYNSLQELDNTISKCPKLLFLDVSIGKEDSQIKKWLPETLHQHHLKSINVAYEHCRFSHICNYLTTKFSSADKWKMEFIYFEECVTKKTVADSLEDLKECLRSILKSKEVNLQFITHSFSVPEVLGLFSTSSQHKNWRIYIDYNETDDKHTNMVRSKNNNMDISPMKVGYPCRPKSPYSAFAGVWFPWNDFYHLNLLGKIGHIIKVKELSIKIPPGFEQWASRDREEAVIAGGALSHLLDYCPELTTLEYTTRIFDTVGPEIRASVHHNLTKLQLSCRSMKQEAFLDLSNLAPNITDLYIRCLYDKDPAMEQEEEFVVNMPQNSFESLKICHTTVAKKFSSSEAMAIKFVKSGKPRYLTVDTANGKKGYILCNEEKYLALCSIPSCAKITVICKSIKNFKLIQHPFRFDWEYCVF